MKTAVLSFVVAGKAMGCGAAYAQRHTRPDSSGRHRQARTRLGTEPDQAVRQSVLRRHLRLRGQHVVVLDGIELPPGYSVRFAGQVKLLEETANTTPLAIGLASIFTLHGPGGALIVTAVH